MRSVLWCAAVVAAGVFGSLGAAADVTGELTLLPMDMEPQVDDVGIPFLSDTGGERPELLPSPTADTYFDVHVQNWCSRPIEVSASWIPIGSGDRWVVDGWWEVRPGREVYILNTANRYVLFYARVTDGSGLEWSGGFCDREVRGERLCMFQTNMGGTFSSFTQNFVCD